MKPFLKLFLSTLLMVSLIQKANSQSTTFGLGAFGHTGAAVATDWCGWQNNVIPFNLEHRGTLDINFLTGGAQRMTEINSMFTDTLF